jgi:hypothetical protein
VLVVYSVNEMDRGMDEVVEEFHFYLLQKFFFNKYQVSSEESDALIRNLKFELVRLQQKKTTKKQEYLFCIPPLEELVAMDELF